MVIDRIEAADRAEAERSEAMKDHDVLSQGVAELRAQVERAVAKLGYVPNRAARSLVTRRADSVAPPETTTRSASTGASRPL